MPGMGELLIILVIVLLIFGAGKLPQIGDALGRSIRNFKRASNSGDGEIEVSKKKEVAAGSKKELAEGDDDDIEDAEVVATRRKAAKKEA